MNERRSVTRTGHAPRLTLLASAVLALTAAGAASAQSPASIAPVAAADMMQAAVAQTVPTAAELARAVEAQTAPPAKADDDEEAAIEEEVEAATPSSTEQGHTQMDEAFAAKSRRDWIRDTRRKAFQDTKWDIQARSYYLDRDKFDDSQSQAWALGGSVGFKTGYFRDRFAFGATGYTSQKLSGDEDKDGTSLLAPGQEGYTVLGEVYGEALLWEGARFTAGRKAFDTPYINRNDTRMTPNTFTAAVLQGIAGGGDQPEWRYGFGYFDEIKEKTSEDFVSMSKDAGAPSGVNEGVWAGGVNYKNGPFTIGAIEYWSDNIISIFYTEAKYTHQINDSTKLNFAGQYTDEESVGDELLTGSDFSADQWGVKGELGYRGALFTAAYTSTGNDTSMKAPWSGYPGYTSVQVDDFNRAGEDAWMLRVGYNFQNVKGLSVYGLWVDGSDPTGSTVYAEKEKDLNLQWNVSDGALKGLMLRLRYAKIDQDAPGSPELTDFRFMVFYDPPRF